jgi:predicted dehydrogenase
VHVTRTVRCAIIGTGGIANAHIRAIQALAPRTEAVAAVDIDLERVETFCRRHSIPRAYTDSAAMLATERPDLVHICTPPRFHAELSIQALEAGAWVLCEKPLCGSLAELDRIEATEQRTGRYCSSVFQWRFGSGAQHLKRLIETQALGRPLVGICNTTWYRDHAYYQVPWRGTWRDELGGPTMGHGIHAMDLFLWLLGGWREVMAMMATLDRAIEVEDVSMALVRFESGALGSIVNSVLSPRQESYLRFDFQKATVELRHLYRYTNADWQYSIPEGAPYQDELEQWRAIPTDVPASHTAQLAALLDCMERNERPITSGPGVRPTIEFIAGLYKSAITRMPVERGSIPPDDPFYHAMNGRVSGGSPG